MSPYVEFLEHCFVFCFSGCGGRLAANWRQRATAVLGVRRQDRALGQHHREGLSKGAERESL